MTTRLNKSLFIGHRTCIVNGYPREIMGFKGQVIPNTTLVNLIDNTIKEFLSLGFVLSDACSSHKHRTLDKYHKLKLSV